MIISRALQTILGLVPFTAPGHFVDPDLVSSDVRPDLRPSRIVDTGYARYLGHFTPPFAISHLGLPYAEPPIDDLRFRKPVPLDTEKLRRKGGILDATKYPMFCIQGTTGYGDAGGAGTEDCLKLNVYSPLNATADSKLPVLFYIHGGAYVYGNPRNWPFEHWINQSPNVVIVSVYYRLDSFGFLTHPAFTYSESPGSLGDHNVGLHDQVLALQWVKENIEAFGGDPGKVTINGQSAGGGSVMLHLVASQEMLFHAAIIQSPDREALPMMDQQEPLFEYFATQANCGNNLDSVEDTMACLRRAPVDDLARAQNACGSLKRPDGEPYEKWRPILDEKFITEYPTKAFVDGKFARVPMIVGATSNETLTPGKDLKKALKTLYPLLGDDDLDEFDKVYDPEQFGSEAERFRSGTGEPNLRCGREIIGGAGVKFAKAWTYRYNQPNPTFHEPGITEHAAENWMMFLGTNTGANGSTTFTGLNDAETAFSEELIAYWLSFVRSHDPNTYKLAHSPDWPDFSTEQRLVLQQYTEDDEGDVGGHRPSSDSYVEYEPEDELKRCEFVASKYEHLQV